MDSSHFQPATSSILRQLLRLRGIARQGQRLLLPLFFLLSLPSSNSLFFYFSLLLSTDVRAKSS